MHHPGIWTWGDNEQVFNDALIWNQEPDDTRHVENCISMTYEGNITDEMCWKKLGYICEYQLPGNDAGCADGWMAMSDSCYYISHTGDPLNLMTWMDALGKCLGTVPGQNPTLITINTAMEYATISQYLATVSSQSTNWWIGLNDQTTEGTYVWTDGQFDFGFLNWETAPNKLALVDKCGVVHGNGHISYGKCNTDLNYYACRLKYTNTQLSTLAELGCTGLWTRAGKKCYYFDTNDKLSQADARKKCQKSGGDLLKISTIDEVNWLTKQKFLNDVSSIWTGLLRKSKGVNSWTWADKSEVNTKFIKWNQEPNNYLGNEDCAVMGSDGIYNDITCNGRAGYICQMQSVNAPCPTGWVMPDAEGSMCYYISSRDDNITTTWFAANEKCKQLANGADTSLFAAQSNDEYTFIIEKLLQKPSDPTGWWTDLTDSKVEGSWQFFHSYNNPPQRKFINWGGEPNDVGGIEDCAVMSYGGRYNDVPCSVKVHVVCEKPATPFPSSGNRVKLYLPSLLLSLLLTAFLHKL